MSHGDFNELLLNLRREFGQAQMLGINNAELYQQQMTQVLMAASNVKMKAQSEIERLQGLIGECRGQIKAAEMFGGLIVETAAAYNRQTLKQQEAEKAQEAEKQERDVSKQLIAAAEAPVLPKRGPGRPRKP